MTETSPRLARPLLVGVFFVAMAMLLLETILTRIFSVTMYYHFAFMVISITLFGMGVSGIFIYLNPSSFPREKSAGQMALAATLFGISVPLSFFLQQALPAAPDSPRWGLLYLGATYLIVALPFFLGGSAISLALTHYSAGVSTLYFSDLVGASVGCSLVFPGLTYLTGPDIVALVGVLGGLAAVSFSRLTPAGSTARRAAPIAAAVLALLFALNATGTFRLLDVPTPRMLKPGTTQPLKSLGVRWNPMARVVAFQGSTRPAYLPDKVDSLFYPEGQILFTLDKSAMTWGVAFDGDFSKVRWILSDVASLPLYLKRGARLLDIGSGGGQHALLAMALGSTDITCVEINPTVVQWTRGRFDQVTGHIYNRPEVHVFVGDGRTFAARSKEKYDVIDFVSSTTFTATTSGAFMMAENNLFTLEAFRAYYDHLTPDGMIGVSQVMTREYPGLLLRVASLGRAVLEEHGVTNVADHVIVIMKKTEGYGNVVIRKSPFTAADVAATDSLAARMGWVVLHSPTENHHPQFHDILTRPDFKTFVNSLPLNLFPPTDDRPFFFNLVPFSRLNQTATGNYDLKYGKVPAQILLNLFFIVIVLTVLFLIVPLLLGRRARMRILPGTAATLGYFSAIGLGFILVEVPLLQRFVLYLGHPVYAISVILFSILLFSGIGSFLTRRIGHRGPRGWLLRTLPALLVVLVLYNVTLERVFALTQERSEPFKILASILLLLPPGLLMGMPFPAMMKRVSGWSPGMVPWCWSVNGAASVLGSVTAVIVALSLGFTASLYAGIAAYLLALICVRLLPRVDEPPAAE